MTGPRFTDRAAAGRLLAVEVAKRNPSSPVVFALLRGGVPVAAPIAEALGAPLDVLYVRKIGAPGQEELAAGSVVNGERPDIVMNDDVVRALRLRATEIEDIARRELKEIERRRAIYQPGQASETVRNRTAILVDDGIATGASMRAAIIAVRRRGPRRIIAATPVASLASAREFSAEVDDFVSIATPRDFGAVGLYYRDFHQVTDEEVIALLRSARASQAARSCQAAEKASR